MCGFTGIYSLNNKNLELNEKWVRESLASMRYRGPDDSRVVIGEFFVAGFNRLAIRDLSSNGMQPFFSASKKSMLLFNGEIYNTEELIEKSDLDSFKFISNSDTEIFIEVVEKKGLEWFLERVDGIFAFSFFDIDSKKLYIGRDHLGIKPLYLGWNNLGEFFFSSEYNHVVNHYSINKKEIIPESLHNFFRYGFIQENEGLFTNTIFVPQKHFITIMDNGKMKLQAYKDDCRTKNDENSDLSKLMREVVKSQIVSDVKIGTFLSGGVDSSIITTVANSYLKNLKVFTIGVNNQDLDESEQASNILSQINPNLEHNLKKMTPNEILQSVDDYLESLGEPLIDYSSLMALKACEISSRELTVILSGDGGDELFWGYPRFEQIYNEKRNFLLPQCLRPFYYLIQRFFFSTRTRLVDLMVYKDWQSYYLSKQGVTGNRYFLKKLFGKKLTKKLPYNFIKLKPLNKYNSINVVRDIEKLIHLQRVLLKMDRASMFYSQELRVPFLSRKIDCFSQNLNFLGNFDKKKLRDLREQLIDLSKIDIDPSKKGFEPPMKDWLKNELKNIVGNAIKEIPDPLKKHIELSRIEKIWNDHQNSLKDNSNVIWGLYSLFMWMNIKITYEN